MSEKKPFIPQNIGVRALWGIGSAAAAGILLGIAGNGALAWNTVGYWLFMVAVFCLAVSLYDEID